MFSNEIYNQFLVLTSATIQKRFLQYKARAKFVEIEKCFQCVNFSPNEYKNIRIVDNISKNVSISTPIRLDKTDDDMGGSIDLERIEFLLIQPVQREIEALNPAKDDPNIIDRIHHVKESLLHVLATITDPAVIAGINQCSTDDVNQLWRQACEVYGLELGSDKRILNPEGYMLAIIENKFR